jgi:hypothetical protein
MCDCTECAIELELAQALFTQLEAEVAALVGWAAELPWVEPVDAATVSGYCGA